METVRTLKHDVYKNEVIKQFSPKSVCHIIHYRVNIISKLMTAEFVTELVKLTHKFRYYVHMAMKSMTYFGLN